MMHPKRAQVARPSLPLRYRGRLITGPLPILVSALALAAMGVSAGPSVAGPQLAGYSALPMQADPEPTDVVEGYFSAINDGDYVAAWALGGKNTVGGRYDDFVESFTDTANEKVTINSVAGETVEVQLDATQSDGSHRYFAGTYTVRDGVIIDADIHASKQPPSTKTPSLYVRTGYERGALYEPEGFPKRIGLDNHNYISGLQWKKPGPSDIEATGTLNENKCEPGCSEGDYVTHPIEVRASDPRKCAVEVYKPYSDEKRMVEAYVYNKISVRALSGNPDQYLVGDQVFSVPCK